jgi:hypothetical protein
MFHFAWKLSAAAVPDAAPARYLLMLRAEAIDEVPTMMTATKRLKNLFNVVILS